MVKLEKTFYLSITIICLLGLSFSIAIIPDEEEIALMYFQDSEYTKAMERYRNLLRQSQPAPQVYIGLTKLHLQNGDVQNAIATLRNLLRKYPDSIEVRDYLGKYYESAQLSSEYMKNLEEMAEINPSNELYRKLSELYEMNSLYKLQVDVLEKVISSKGYQPREHDFLPIIDFYAKNNDLDKSIARIKTLHDSVKAPYSDRMIEMITHITLDSDEKVLCDNILNDYLRRLKASTTRDKKLELLTGILCDRLEGKTALDLLKKHTKNITEKLPLFSNYVRAKLQIGEKRQVYTQLRQLFFDRKLHSSLNLDLFDLIIELKEFDDCVKIIKSVDIKTLDNKTLNKTAVSAIVHKRPDIAIAVENKFTADELNELPFLKLTLQFAQGKGNLENLVNTSLEKNLLSEDDTVNLIRICNEQNNEKLGFKLFSRMTVIEALNTLEVDEISTMIIKHGDHQKYQQQLKSSYGKISDYQNFLIDKVRLLVATSDGSTDLFNEIFFQIANKGTQLLKDVYYVAMENRQADIAVDMAKQIYKEKSTKKNAILLSEALLLAENHSDAVDVVTEFIKQGDKRAFQQFMYAINDMISKKGKKELAQYRDVAIQASLKQIKEQSLTSIEKKELGYFLVNIDETAHAKEIFRLISKGKSIDSPEVEQLIYLTELTPDNDTIKWFTNQAIKAAKHERPFWLIVLNRLKQYQKTTEITPAPINSWDSIPYIEALLYLKQPEKAAITQARFKQTAAKLPESLKMLKVANLVQTGFFKEAVELVDTITLEKLLNLLSPSDLARVYLDAPKDKLSLRLNSFIAKTKDNKLISKAKDTATAYYLMTEDLTRLASSIKSSPPAASSNLLANCFFITQKQKDFKRSALIAEELQRQYPSDNHTIFLIEASFLAEDYHNVMKLSPNDLLLKNKNLRSLYLSSANELFNKGGKTLLTNYTDQLKAFSNELIKLKQATVDELRDMGYTLANIEMKKEAIPIFFHLSQKDPVPENPDCAQLLYLCGKEPPEKVVKWITKQAQSSHAQRKLLWLKYLLEVGKADNVVNIIEDEK